MSETVNALLTPDQVDWERTEAGLSPFMSVRDLQTVAQLTDYDGEDLIAAMDDPEHFVKAHVALTWITGIDHETHPTWNGLAVQLTPDGWFTIDPAQRHALQERWRNWFDGVA